MRDLSTALSTPISATLDASTGIVTFGTNIEKDRLFTIVNVTDNTEIYTANDPANGGSMLTASTLQLDHDTTGMADTDLLQVLYEGVGSGELATEAKQDTGNTSLATIAGKDFATQTTLAALLAKVIAAPATEAKQDTLIAKDFATQTTLAAVLAKLIAAPATEAKQDTQITAEQAIQSAIGSTTGAAVITDANGTVQQYLRGLIKQWIAGTLVLGTGANAIGKLAANSGVDIGDVDVTSVIPGTGATNLGKAEDAAHTSGDVGVMHLGVRNDAATSFGGAEGDYVPAAHDAYGNTRVRGASLPTYMLATATFTPVATATDIFTFNGSSTKTVRLLRLILSGTQTTAGNLGTISIIKRSTAGSGGTPVTATLIPVDSGFSVSTVTAQHYTANPTVGTPVGTIWNPRGLLAQPSTNNSGIYFDVNFQDILNGCPVTLRGTSETIAINMGGGALPSGAANFQVTAIWTEA